MTVPQYPGHPTSGETPVCPRHPDRIAYVRCQRCHRPTCPECQRPASVGVQCVDCVNQARAAAPTIRTRFGGRDRGARPVVTQILIAACVAIHVLVQWAPEVRSAFAFVPVVGEQEPWRFLTAAFLHSGTVLPSGGGFNPGGLLHLGLNMYALWILGSVLEPMLGRWRFLTLYLLSALGGSVAVLLLASPQDVSWITGVVGASGAVFGLFAAVGLLLRRLRRDTTQILVLLGVNVFISFTVPGISWQAHLGGLVTGAILAAAYVYAPRQRRLALAVGASVGVAVLLVALSVLRYSLV